MQQNKLFETLLDVIPFSTYVVDIETYEVIYINRILSDKMYAPREKQCWKMIYGQDEKCSWCTIPKLIQSKKPNKNKKIVGTFFDEASDTWLQNYDEILTWPDGRQVKCSIAVDITEQKEMQASLIQTHTKLARQTKKLQDTYDKLKTLSKKDYLTNIHNRGSLFDLGEKYYNNDPNCTENIMVAMFDLDKFKQLNDTYGHKLGDNALVAFCNEVEKFLDKDSDIFGRLGGEEFALITKGPSEEEILLKLEIIRKSIENITIIHDSLEVHFTVSIGLARREIGETLDMTLEKADKLLYDAKNCGRNQIKFRL